VHAIFQDYELRKVRMTITSRRSFKINLTNQKNKKTWV